MWLHERSSCKPLEKSLRNGFEVKQTGHFGFGANDELKILNRTMKIDVLNDEMTLDADTKLVQNALESMNRGKKALIHHVSGELKSKQHRKRIPRNSRQRSRLCTAAW